MSAAPPTVAEGPLALVCGGGSLPLAVADHVSARGRRVLLFPLRDAADPKDFAGREHHWIHVGQFGRVMRIARAQGCREIVLIGSLVRPSLWSRWPDWTTLKMLPRIVAAYRGGDNHLLSNVAKLVEQQGFTLRGAHEVAPEILAPRGALGRLRPSAGDEADIALALDYLATAGRFDIGQAAVVVNRHIVAVEAAEGTDGMLARVAALRAEGRIPAPKGVLVKAPKPQQDRRFDLPSIGPKTVEAAAGAGLAGVAVIAGETVVADPAALADAADRAGLFVIGVGGPAA
ncbi:MAG TPA: UDP-2,3-diacylglucosamine diphosphatase LpxI [Pseudolabrys sp.]|jgi:UDP-2,3-diacylglucosamine hydrolase|uniref:LpxI family protein n=1 Tax=Pseudolabrys sp. TaxID=1960880 RepID=UPI002DDCEAB3|nr:UDP-2,3-diacylglucosamine diphosphatase LpxI [Pseudolabrys sp.]HEV2630442.1 UDP-2,3-diacylglucosamine diphosphatase LpxI [Pseudolabrys sp.]